MKTISNDFKAALKKIKQIDAVISYADRENTNFIITQNSEFLLTQAQDFLVTESADVRIDNGGIQNCAIYWNTDIFKSACKMIDLETSNAIPKGTEINVKIGLLVGDDYEYVDYGKFYINEEPNYNLDTGTYTTTGYDKMIFFNIKAIENPLTFESGTTYTLKQYLNMICDKCGVAHSFDFSNVINGDEQIISGDPYDTNKDVTYRDIIDDIAECLGTNFIIDANNKITNKEILMTSNITIDADILKDSNVYIGEKKDAIDGLQVYDGSAILNYTGDDSSILKIKNNNIMNAHSDDLMAGVLSMIRDFVYYAYSLDTFGILALEPFDCFTVSYNNTNYLLCSFHNDIKLSSGLTEEISYEFNENDDVYEYSMSSNDDKIRDASIEIDKANGQIVLKADSNGKIVKAELNADANEGTSFNVKADNINLEGYTTINGSFKIDTSGNMECSNANITGGKIKITDTASTNNPGISASCTNQYHTLSSSYNSNGITISGDNLKNRIYARLRSGSTTGSEYAISHDNNDGTFRSQISGTVDNYNSKMYLQFGVNSIEINNNGSGSTEYSPGQPFIKVSKEESTNSTMTHNGVYAPAFVNTSTEKSKSNIKKLDIKGIETIKNTDLYNYNYIGEKKNSKKHIGIVIGDKYKCAEELKDSSNQGIDLYAMSTICFQAIKEQQEQIEKLQKEIEFLKGDGKNGK